MSECAKILSPDGRTAVSVADGVARVRFGGKSVLSWSFKGSFDGAAVRELVADGVLLARELRAAPGLFVRVADGAVGFFHKGASVKMPSTFVRAEVLSSNGIATLTRRVVCEGNASPCRIVLSNGMSATLLRGGGASFVVVGDRPVDVLLPRALRFVACQAGRRFTGDGAVNVDAHFGVDASFDVHAAFVASPYALADLRAAGLRGLECGESPNGRAMAASTAVHCTKAHVKAVGVLLDPSFAEAANGFRGEAGEYLAGARRSGRKWHVAGITAKQRVLTLFFPYLEGGVEYAAKWNCDGEAPQVSVVKAGDAVEVKMAAGGGFVATLAPLRKRR